MVSAVERGSRLAGAHLAPVPETTLGCGAQLRQSDWHRPRTSRHPTPRPTDGCGSEDGAKTDCRGHTLGSPRWRATRPSTGRSRGISHRWYQTAASACGAPIACGASARCVAGAPTTAEVEVPRGAAVWECTSQTLAHRRMVPPATTSRMTPQSHQSFLSPNLLIACITARRMCGSGGLAASSAARRVDFPHGSADIAVALTLPRSIPARAQVFFFR
jgi:hypothetical protein